MERESKWGYYNSNLNDDASCPNCGERKEAAHLYLCPNKDRVGLFTESVNNLEGWMKKRNKIGSEISYWLLMYTPF